MIRVLLVAPYREFADRFTEVFRQHDEHPEESYELSVQIAAGIEELRSLRFDADVVISRGFLSADLAHLDHFVPLVEVPVASLDLAQSLHRARQEFGDGRVAVVGARNMVMGVERLAEELSIEVLPFVLSSRAEIRRTVEQIHRAGIGIVVGGVSTCGYARELGLGAVLLESGPEAIWHSISEAKRVAYVVRREEERSHHLRALVNQADEGIILTDREGAITLFNRAAARIFAVEAGLALGKPLRAVLPSLPDIAPTASDETRHEIFQHGSRHISATISNLCLRGEPLGRLVTAQDVSSVQELEGRIRERIYARGHVARHTFEDIIGESPRILETVARAKKYSVVDSNVLIVGKTGTGKELFAQSIHNYSPRRRGPFVAVNCAALSESLLESELFGYAEGAFTGAARGGKPGLFELAHRGTLFLDEISEIPMRLQGRLLRAIQEKEIMRLGHDRVIPVDVRLIAATNRVLQGLVDEGGFREDLFYRINILKIELPDLAQRPEDIPALVDHWVGVYCRQFGFPALTVTSKARAMLGGMPWPGNIRQLRSVCERLVVLSQCDVIDAKDVEVVMETVAPPTGSLAGRPAGRAEIQTIEEALRSVGENRSEAARQLGISRTTLWRRLKQLKQA